MTLIAPDELHRDLIATVPVPDLMSACARVVALARMSSDAILNRKASS